MQLEEIKCLKNTKNDLKLKIIFGFENDVFCIISFNNDDYKRFKITKYDLNEILGILETFDFQIDECVIGKVFQNEKIFDLIKQCQIHNLITKTEIDIKIDGLIFEKLTIHNLGKVKVTIPIHKNFDPENISIITLCELNYVFKIEEFHFNWFVCITENMLEKINFEFDNKIYCLEYDNLYNLYSLEQNDEIIVNQVDEQQIYLILKNLF